MDGDEWTTVGFDDGMGEVEGGNGNADRRLGRGEDDVQGTLGMGV